MANSTFLGCYNVDVVVWFAQQNIESSSSRSVGYQNDQLVRSRQVDLASKDEENHGKKTPKLPCSSGKWRFKQFKPLDFGWGILFSNKLYKVASDHPENSQNRHEQNDHLIIAFATCGMVVFDPGAIFLGHQIILKNGLAPIPTGSVCLKTGNLPMCGHCNW